MFCDQCGREMAPEARFCTNCGRQVAPAAPPQFSQPNPAAYYGMPNPAVRLQNHVRTLGILWLVSGILRGLELVWLVLVGKVFLPSVLSHLSGFASGFPLDRLIEGGIAVGAAIVTVQTVLAFAAAWGLLEKQTWGRIVAIIAGILSLLHFPLGTALGIYTLWILLPASADAEYQRQARA